VLRLLLVLPFSVPFYLSQSDRRLRLRKPPTPHYP